MTIRATDGDADDNISLVYGIVPDFADFKGFEINATTGELTFRNPPDYEALSSKNQLMEIICIIFGRCLIEFTRIILCIVTVYPFKYTNESAPVSSFRWKNFGTNRHQNQQSVMILRSDDLNASLTQNFQVVTIVLLNWIHRLMNYDFLVRRSPIGKILQAAMRNYEVYVSVTDGELESELKIYLEIIM